LPQVSTGIFDQLSPPNRRYGHPLFWTKGANLLIPVNDLVILSSPRQSEITNPVIVMCQVKVEQATELAIEE
jgi:hypothetical protein